MAHRKQLEIEKHRRKKQVNDVNNSWRGSQKRKENIEAAEASKRLLKDQLDEMSNTLIPLQQRKLHKYRSEIMTTRGDGLSEYSEFHVDRTKDGRGFTILMIAAQNDDVSTARKCFDFGANPFVKGPSGLTAIQYSHFFGHDEVTALIIKVSAMLHPFNHPPLCGQI